jgi:hypothetical protein
MKTIILKDDNGKGMGNFKITPEMEEDLKSIICLKSLRNPEVELIDIIELCVKQGAKIISKDMWKGVH